ncbi:MAG: flagellar hook-length control protein FliK [Hyphomicrobiales bacterium]
MYQLPPLPKQVQKSVTSATAPVRQTPKKQPTQHNSSTQQTDRPQPLKKDAAHSSKANEAQKTANKTDTKDGVTEEDGIEFANLVSEAEAVIAPENVEATANTEATSSEADENTLDVGMVTNNTVTADKPIAAAELASAKLSEFNLNTNIIDAPQTDQETNIGQATKPADETNTATPEKNADLALNAGKPQDISAQSEKVDGQIKIVASNDKLTVEAASVANVDAEITSKSSSARNEDFFSDLIKRLENLSADALEKAGVKPEQLSKIINHVENMLSMVESGEVELDTEKLINQITSILTQNANGEAKSAISGAVEKAALDANTDANVRALRDLAAKSKQANMLNDNVSTQDEVELSKTQGLNIKTGDLEAKKPSAMPAQQSADHANNANVQVEASKYANRYNKYANQENSAAPQTEEAATSQETVSASKLTAAYNSAKSNVSASQSAAQTMSALDKVNQKSPMDFLTQMQNSTESQATGTQNQENVVNVKLAMQNGRLGQNLPLNSMAFQIGKQFSKGNSEFQIRLDPAELGRINIKLSLKQGGNVKAHMVVERNDVFELLQRDARALEKALSDAGFDGKDVDVEFSLDQNASNGGTFAENFFDQTNDNQSGQSKTAGENTNDEEIEQMVATHMPLHVESTGIDRTI